MKLEFDNDLNECILTFIKVISIYLLIHIRDTSLLWNKGLSFFIQESCSPLLNCSVTISGLEEQNHFRDSKHQNQAALTVLDEESRWILFCAIPSSKNVNYSAPFPWLSPALASWQLLEKMLPAWSSSSSKWELQDTRTDQGQQREHYLFPSYSGRKGNFLYKEACNPLFTGRHNTWIKDSHGHGFCHTLWLSDSFSSTAFC